MQKNRRTWQDFDEMRKAAEQGDAAAQCYLGICYQTGQGVAQDYTEALRWFRRAADQNVLVGMSPELLPEVMEAPYHSISPRSTSRADCTRSSAESFNDR